MQELLLGSSFRALSFSSIRRHCWSEQPSWAAHTWVLKCMMTKWMRFMQASSILSRYNPTELNLGILQLDCPKEAHCILCSLHKIFEECLHGQGTESMIWTSKH